MKINFVILSHNEPEIFGLLDQLHGHQIFIIDDWSEEDYYKDLKAHSSRPTVIRRSLNKNFADQRNFAMQFIPEGEWIFSIDADERLHYATFPLCSEIHENGPEAFRILRSNVTKKMDGSTVRFDERHVRLFRNCPDRIYWVYRLHEYLVGFKTLGDLVNEFITHEKTEERCSSQHQFYGERFNHEGVDISKALAVEGFSAESELRWLAQEAAKRSIIVEIGSWKGRSTRALADNAHGVVYAVDDFFGSVNEESFTESNEKATNRAIECFSNISDLISGGRVIPLKLSSFGAGKFFEESKIQPDMVFIDGTHTTDAVVMDIALWSQILAPDGLLCGHDANGADVQEGLKQAGIDYYVVPGTTIWVRK